MALREMATLIDNSKPYKSPEERIYLLCLQDTDTGARDWDIVIGRMEAYNQLKNQINYIDLSASFILVETVTFADRISIYKFMKTIGDTIEDGFDIDDYVKGDWSETDFQNGSIDSSVNVNPNERLNMEDVMNGFVETNDL